VVGADHQVFGDALTTKWKFPRHLRAAVGFHHTPEVLSVELQKLGFTVHVADVLCCQQQIGFYQTADVLELSDEVLQGAGIDRAKLEEVTVTLHDELEDTQSMLSG
jgi:HD-like signal output (HDOD) protein